MPKALILTGFGINCEEEMAAAYRLAGGQPTIVHLNEVLHGRVSIHDFDILNFPGGFSFGDDLGSGVVLANKLRYRQTGANGRTLLSDIREFVAAGKFVLGICNGFQVLVKLGLLPNLGGDFQPEVTLTHNASGRYENRWVRLKVNPLAKTPFLRGLTTLAVPVRHGEGRLVVPDAAIRNQLTALGLNCLTYADGDDVETGTYPLNPNGADLDCAGLTDPTGHIFGLMPHPEAYLAGCNHPDWGTQKRQGTLRAEGEGLAIFYNIVRHLQARPSVLAPLAAEKKLATNDLPASLVEESKPQYELWRQREAELTTTTEQVARLASQAKWEASQADGRPRRKPPTPAEEELWQALRGQKLGVAFRRQYALAGYFAAFVALPAKLVVEVLASPADEPAPASAASTQAAAFQGLGYRVVSFTTEQILTQLPLVLQTITATLNASTQA